MRALGFVSAALILFACDGGLFPDGECTPDEDGLAFCGDRVDDDCEGGDESCPATKPADAPPDFDCDSDNVPANVLFWTDLPSNEQVESGCVFVYQGETDAFYAAVDITNGSDPQGPEGKSTGECSYDYSARRHLFFTESPTKDCDDLEYTYPDDVANQLLSNDCRKMVRNIAQSDGDFDPDIQFLPGDLDDQRKRIERFDTAEVACLRINNASGEPYRPDEVFVTQSARVLQENLAFEAQ